jgi:hypothetical protein
MVQPDLFHLLSSAKAVAKFCLHKGKTKSNIQTKNKYTCNYTSKYTCVSVYTAHVLKKKYADNNRRKVVKKMQFTT